jgi:cell division protein FtsB
LNGTLSMRDWLSLLIKYGLVVVAAAVIFDRALACQSETRRLARERRHLRAEIRQMRRRNARLNTVRRALDSDPFYVERILRERYGYRRPTEAAPVPPRTVRSRSILPGPG